MLGGCNMAQPIGATPILRGKNATRFLNQVCKNANKPVGLIATPKLAEAEKLIKQLSTNGNHIR
jgi:hypothetical protein